MKPVSADPPLLVGAAQLTVALMTPPAAPAIAVGVGGAPGTVGAVGVTVFDAADSGPAPIAFTAWTRKLYAVPAVRVPITVLVAVPGTPVTVRTTVVPVRTCTL